MWPSSNTLRKALPSFFLGLSFGLLLTVLNKALPDRTAMLHQQLQTAVYVDHQTRPSNESSPIISKSPKDEPPITDRQLQPGSSRGGGGVRKSSSQLLPVGLPIGNNPYLEGLRVQDRTSEEGPRILCYLLVGPSTHSTALHVKNTWAQRCDTTLYFSTKEDPQLPTVVLRSREGYRHLWAKNQAALRHVHRYHLLTHDWFLKADTDTYIIVENLRYFLSQQNASEPVYHGVRFNKFVKQGYMSGGGGYVMSREAVNRLVTVALHIQEQNLCPHQEGTKEEDVAIGLCLESVGVAAGNSLDQQNKPRFFSHRPEALFFKSKVFIPMHWYWRYLWHPHGLGPDCCSQDLISFHEIDPRMMWTLEFLLYRLRIHRDLQPQASNYSTTSTPL